jgi:hypothetical protein
MAIPSFFWNQLTLLRTAKLLPMYQNLGRRSPTQTDAIHLETVTYLFVLRLKPVKRWYRRSTYLFR